MTSQPEQPHGTGSTDVCWKCGGSKWIKRKSEDESMEQTVDYPYVGSTTIKSKRTLITWECANPKCRVMMQTEKSTGWHT